jgi:hypothetical protein
MEFALILRELLGRRRMLAVGVVLAAVASIFSVYRLHDGKLQARGLVYSSATTQVFVDGPSSALGNLARTFEPLETRAAVYANFMASPTVVNLIGQKAGIPGDQLYAAGPVDPSLPRTVQEPTAVERNIELTGETKPYRLNFNDDPNLPTIGIFAQAPTTAEAIRLADASVAALQEYVTGLETSEKTTPTARVIIRQLGEATGGPVDSGIKKSLAVIVFVMVLVLWAVLMLVGRRALAAWRASAVIEATLAPMGPGGWERLDRVAELDALASGTGEPAPQLDAPAKRAAASAAGASRESKAFTKPTRPTKVGRGSKQRGAAKTAAEGEGNGSVAALGPGGNGAAPSQAKRETANGTQTEVARASFRRYISRTEEERTG